MVHGTPGVRRCNGQMRCSRLAVLRAVAFKALDTSAGPTKLNRNCDALPEIDGSVSRRTKFNVAKGTA